MENEKEFNKLRDPILFSGRILKNYIYNFTYHIVKSIFFKQIPIMRRYVNRLCIQYSKKSLPSHY
ncbi:hypothetical protein Bmyc01_58340 [Bacillus mycoides]|nr:hypothetical protein Bmyc01_58340 [Bacillus mycoides]